jgi:hypothetical protein
VLSSGSSTQYEQPESFANKAWRVSLPSVVVMVFQERTNYILEYFECVRVVLLFSFCILISFTSPVQILKQNKNKNKTYGYKHLYTKDSKGIIYSSRVTTALRLVHNADMVSRSKAAKGLHSTVTGKCKP